jgi:hypothetical protein
MTKIVCTNTFWWLHHWLISSTVSNDYTVGAEFSLHFGSSKTGGNLIFKVGAESHFGSNKT